ncbi:hypothetical protein FKW77_006951 [Venturia effusa]|uniref:Uncharacterized protein n=1 Tax=Venturia effusa TaxID=50376 RepID=A0A517LJ21_9PEZI|nr:hypothetical protein FKW77_006951 [Venturia effusa]
MLNYHAVRAKWETQTQRRDCPSRQHLVPRSTVTKENKPNRLASLAMFNKSLTSLRPKGFRNRHLSGGNQEANQSTMTLAASHRDSFNSAAPPSSPPTVLRNRPSNSQSDPAPAPLVRSSTTSFLPVPTKPATTSPNKALVQSKTSSLFRSRIPTPPGRQPAYLPRSITQPALPDGVTPRKASETSRPNPQKRFGVSKWSFAEETRPLLQPMDPNTLPIPYASMRTPSASSSSSGGGSRQQLSLPRRMDSLPQHLRGKENTRHVIQRHTLLQPVQPEPLSPKSAILAEAGPIALPVFFNTPGSTPPLHSKQKGGSQTLVESAPRPEVVNVSDSTPLLRSRQTSPQTPSPEISRAEVPEDPRKVHTTMPNAYWAGRFCGLNDQIMNSMSDAEHHASGFFSPKSFTSYESDALSRRPDGRRHPVAPPGSAAQALHVLQLLESMCTTDHAKISLLKFRNVYADTHFMPALKVEVPKLSLQVFRSMAEDAKKKQKEEAASRKTSGSSTDSNAPGGRKMTFMDRLRGRKSRLSSGKSNRADSEL